ncbi:MAG: hypothetical protein HBSAPP01_02680 [Candidatus Brocadia sapporoensis]|nr:MAG: hypothetical protein HBSAPP01_02680 [Candidatus Brocadia sapporoensis]
MPISLLVGLTSRTATNTGLNKAMPGAFWVTQSVSFMKIFFSFVYVLVHKTPAKHELASLAERLKLARNAAAETVPQDIYNSFLPVP